MIKESEKIIEFLEDILSKKEFINEVTMSSPLEKITYNSKFGPRWGRMHHGVDLAATSGTEILSPADGTVSTAEFRSGDCGGTLLIKHADFSTRYCHVKEFRVAPNSTVTKGQVVGLTGGGASDKGRGNSGGPHLHFELYVNGKPVDPEPYLSSPGVKVTGVGSQPTTSTGSTTTTGSQTTSTSDSTVGDKLLHPDKFIGSVGSSIDDKFGNPKTESVMSEQTIFSKFGKNMQTKYGDVILKASDNSKIFSAIDGVVKTRGVSTCKDEISIETDIDGFLYYLIYCGITDPKVKKGEKVSSGQLIGKTNTDVTVSLYNRSGQRQSIELFMNKTKKEKKEKPLSLSGEKLLHPDKLVDLMGKLIDAPLSIFRDKYDKDGNMISKRWGSPTDPDPVDPFFQKMSPTYKKK